MNSATLTNNPLKPPLKWAGGKRWLVPYILPYWQCFSERRLVEPLSGGLAVSLALMPAAALINDINPHVINFFLYLQKGLSIRLEMKNDKETYYLYRDRFNRLIESGAARSREAAELFYYLNRTGYNGLCRFNKRGFYNVPFGSYKNIKYKNDFSHYCELVKKWQFLSVDFECLSIDKGDFVYADPPYDVEFTSYSKEGFRWEDQVRLARWLAAHNGPVILSNQATPRIIDLYGKLGFHLKYYPAPRMISCNGDRTPVKEVLAFRGF